MINRREFLKIAGAGAISMLLGSYGMKELAAAENESIPGVANEHMLRIAVITSSPHREGTTDLLTDRFIDGAKEAGHEIFRFNAAFKEIIPCTACGECQRTGACVFKDSVELELMPKLLAADVVVLSTPVYYFDMTAQLKLVIDRFYVHSQDLRGKKSILLAAAGSDTGWTMDALADHYASLVDIFGWQDAGAVMAVKSPTREAVAQTLFPEEAYTIGCQL